MDKEIIKGLKHSLGFILGLSLFLGLVYAVGFHSANEVLGGIFQGDYQFNGSVNFTNANVSGLNVATQSKIVNVYYNFSNTQISTTSITYVDAGVSLTFNLTNASNKVLIRGGSSLMTNGLGCTRQAYLGIDRGGILAQGSYMTYESSGNNYHAGNIVVEKLDSPATTNQITYKLMFAHNNACAGPSYAQFSGYTGWLTAMEIKP